MQREQTTNKNFPSYRLQYTILKRISDNGINHSRPKLSSDIDGNYKNQIQKLTSYLYNGVTQVVSGVVLVGIPTVTFNCCFSNS